MLRGGATSITYAIAITSILGISAGYYAIALDDQPELIDENELIDYTNDAIDDVTIYLKTQEVLGYLSTNSKCLERVAILVSPMFSVDLNIDDIVIKISDGSNINFFYYGNKCSNLNSYSVFSHEIWNEIISTNFGIIIIQDMDNSIISNIMFNDNSDIIYLIFKIPEDIKLNFYDKLDIDLILSKGVSRSLKCTIPFSSDNIVKLH